MTLLALDDLKRSLPLKWITPDTWTELALANIPKFLQDHASCERKAHAAAMMLVNRYSEHTELQDRMISLAREELLHFQQVVGLMRARHIPIGIDEVDPYVKALLAGVRHPKDLHLLDRLLVAGVIEARSCERFCMMAAGLPPGELRDFYQCFALEEGAHFPLFINTAKLYYPADTVNEGLEALLIAEANLMPNLALTAKVH